MKEILIHVACIYLAAQFIFGVIIVPVWAFLKDEKERIDKFN